MGWRLILDVARGAAENMAIDEAILRACGDGSVPPTVRIYSWDRPSISLGCLQSVLRRAQDDGRGRFDFDYCRQAGIEVVRRITGGRAVIHGSDVTFCIAIRESDLPEGCRSVISSHHWLMGGIVAGLRLLGIDAEIGPERESISGRDAPADCFAHVAQCDVRVGRGKAVGSAQVRRFGALLEQGSIPYALPEFDTARVFGRRSAAGGGAVEGFSYSAIADAVARGFREHLQGALELGELSLGELQMAAELSREKYSTEAWTMRRGSL